MSKVLGQRLGIPVWITEFEAYAKVKGFYKVMVGTEVLQLMAQVNKSAEELKVEERNDTGYCTMLLAMESTGKAFTMVALVRSQEVV